MIDVAIHGRMNDAAALQAASLRRQYAFRFMAGGVPGAITLNLLDFPEIPAFEALRESGVNVCTFRSSEIAAYAGVPRGDYLLLLSMLGLVQYQALIRNPLFREEDFMHGEPGNCLFTWHPTLTEYIPLLEAPEICPYCRHFYGSLLDTGILSALAGEVDWCRKMIAARWSGKNV